jgi:hypothetical protein
MLRGRYVVWALYVVVFSLIASTSLTAAIKAMTTEEAVAVFDGAIYGQIISKEVVPLDYLDRKSVTFTRLTIQGEDLYTGEPATRQIYYMGGVRNGRLDSPSTAPKEHQTRVGASVVVFYWFHSEVTAAGAYKTSSFASLFQVQQGVGEPTVIGLVDSPVPENVKLDGFRTQVQAIYKELQARKQK